MLLFGGLTSDERSGPLRIASSQPVLKALRDRKNEENGLQRALELK